MDANASKYRKELANFSIEYDPAKAYYTKHRPFILQVSLGEMKLEDAFWVELGPEYVSTRLEEFLEEIFSGNKRQQGKIRSLLDVKENPDLPDMYSALLEIFAQWRSSKCNLQFFANQGPEIRLTDRLDDHLSIIQSQEYKVDETPLFDLVIDQNVDVLDYLDTAGYFKNKRTIMEFMQANMLLYLIDKHEYKLPVNPVAETDKNLLPIAKVLQSAKLITPANSDSDRTFAISANGRQAIGKVIAETESYIDQFDVFKDVLHDADSGALEFDTGNGRDLRVQMYEAEEIDPVRVVFLLSLYDSTFDDLPHWQEAIHSEQFFGNILSPVLNAERVDDEMVEFILEAGYNYSEELFEAAGEVDSQEGLLRRIRDE